MTKKKRMKINNCSYCNMPTKGTESGTNYCVCKDTEVIERCKNSVKLQCSSCGCSMIDKDPLKRYFSRGNYCGICSAKPVYSTDDLSGTTYQQYLERAGINKIKNLETNE